MAGGQATASQHLASGAVSGFTSAICLQPLDLLKTRMQQGASSRSALQSSPGVVVVASRRTVGQVAAEVVRQDGMVGLWRGTVPTVVR